MTRDGIIAIASIAGEDIFGLIVKNNRSVIGSLFLCGKSKVPSRKKLKK